MMRLMWGLVLLAISGCGVYFPEGIDCKFGEGCVAKDVYVSKYPAITNENATQRAEQP